MEEKDKDIVENTNIEGNNQLEENTKKSKNSKTMEYMALGILLGVTIGVSRDELSTWLPLGMLWGLVLGMFFD